MAGSKPEAPPAYTDDDWEEVQPSLPDDTISIISDSEIAAANNQDYVEIEHPKQTAYPGRIYRNPKDEPTGPLPTLRRALYNLKDTLKDSIMQLENFNQEASMQALSLSGPIMQAQQRQVDTLNVLLTNYAADWETYAKKGGMTFDEFADLDPVSVDELCRIFGDFVAEIRERNICGRVSDAEEGKDGRGEIEDEDEDVGWLDFILPAVDEVSMLLRVQEQETKDAFDNDQHGKAKEEQHVEKKESLEPEGSASATKEPSCRKETHDDKVHEKMMMVSDW